MNFVSLDKGFTMDISLEKQKIKQELDKVNDESIILTIKKLLGLTTNRALTPLTQEQLIARALDSEKAIANKQYITLDDLEKEMQNW